MGRHAGRIALFVTGLGIAATAAVSVALAAGPGTVHARVANPFAGVNRCLNGLQHCGRAA